MKIKNHYYVQFYYKSKLTYPAFFIIFKLFWYSYIYNNCSSNKVNLTVKLLKEPTNNWIVFSSDSFNTLDFEGVVLYFKNLFIDKDGLYVSGILFVFSFDYNYNRLNIIKSEKTFSIWFVLLILYIYSILIVFCLLYFDTFYTTYLFSNVVDLVNNIELYNTEGNGNHILTYNNYYNKYFVNTTLKLDKPSNTNNIPETIKLLNDYYNSELYKNSQNLLWEIDKLIDLINKYK